MIRGIHHAAISVPDLNKAMTFYCDLLGFEKILKFKWAVGSESSDKVNGLTDTAVKAVIIKKGNACLELFQYSSPEPKPGAIDRPVCDHGITHICLDVTDIEAEYERLKSLGMVFHCPPQSNESISVTYGRDPFGNVVELQEIFDKSLPTMLQWD